MHSVISVSIFIGSSIIIIGYYGYGLKGMVWNYGMDIWNGYMDIKEINLYGY